MLAKTKNNRILIIFLSALGLLVVLVGGGFFWYQFQLQAVSKTSEEVAFTVNSKTSFNSVLAKLEEEGIIKSSQAAKISAKLNNLRQVKAGTYSLDKSWNTETILKTLNDSSAAQSTDIRLTFVEGDWAKHIAEKIGDASKVNKDDLLALWNDQDYIRSLMSDYPFLTEEIFNEQSRILLEGYLFPETYNFFQDSDANQITRKILDQTNKVYQEFKTQFESSQLSIHQLFTLASIVQYEASKPDDMKMVAGVFYNRINTNMKLQSSVTVCYAIDKEKSDDWTHCEVNPDYDSPYNTYKVEGLPPGPILNPGKDALIAVIEPEQTENFYFMADVYGDGTVYYAKTYAEHQANVNRYLKKK